MDLRKACLICYVNNAYLLSGDSVIGFSMRGREIECKQRGEEILPTFSQYKDVTGSLFTTLRRDIIRSWSKETIFSSVEKYV